MTAVGAFHKYLWNAAAASLKTDCAKKSPRSKETQSTFTAALTKREVTQVHPAVEPSKFAVNKIHKYFSSKFYYVYPITFSGSSCDPLIEELLFLKLISTIDAHVVSCRTQ